MSLVRRVFYKELLTSITAVLLGFIMLFVTIDGLGELKRVGQLDYTFVTLLQVLALRVPEYVYQLLPICALIGSILALSNMAARSELVVWRVSGLSLMKLVRLVVAILAVALWLLGDVGISNARRTAKDVANKALHRDAFFSDAGGYWSKQNLPTGGFRMINIKNIKDGSVLQQVSLYELTPAFALNRLVEAQSATEKSPGLWALQGVRVVDVQPNAQGLTDGSKETRLEGMDVDLAENSLNVIRNSGEQSTSFSIGQLQERIQTLQATGQNTRSYEVAYWQKIMYPFGIVIMLLLALPFAFMQTRRGGVGVRVFTGIMLGLLFFILTVVSQSIGGLISMSPIVLAAAPSALFLVIAVLWIYRVTRV